MANCFVCHKCGADPFYQPNIVLVRTNELGVEGVFECSPNCGVPFINNRAALIYAIDNAPSSNKKEGE